MLKLHMRDSMQLSISPPEEDEAMRSKSLPLEPISFESTCQRCGKSETYQGLFKLVVYTCRACEAEGMRGTYINFRGEIISAEEADRTSREAAEGVMALLRLGDSSGGEL